jgi:glutamate-ammonia-ligase adenylyltransferase
MGQGWRGHSPYLADLAAREADTLQAIEALGPDAVCDLVLSGLARVAPALDRAQTAALLRSAKRRIALAAALADIGGTWSLDQVTGALSELADHALKIATGHLLRAAHDRGELRLPHPGAPARGSGFTVLALGKLGARELNFSSDVDLILIFDPGAHAYNADALGAIFARLARDLVSLMQHRDAGGYVFRVDLRLRPDPGSTPPAISLPAALAYYEGAAHTWERAAMIKARPVAGDLLLGRRFLDAIRPFIWRRHLDFAAIADISAMKRRMDEASGAALPEDGPAARRVLGHDVKLGHGGIREIEFYAQTLQLVWGGHNPGLRVAATRPALRAAHAAGHLAAEMLGVLSAAYDFLRRVEHRLQMVADRQTHVLPTSAEGLEGFARFMGFPDGERFAGELLGHLEPVYAAFGALLQSPGAAPDLPPAMLEAPAVETGGPWEAWLAARPRALRTERARELLRELLPAIAAAVARQAQPELVWARLDDFIYRLPAGVQLFSMLHHNPALIDRLAEVLGASPSLADHLAEIPAALEGLLRPAAPDHHPAAALAASLNDAASVDDALAIASRFVRGEAFRVAVAELDGRIDQDEAGEARTDLADAAISCLLPRVMADHRRRYGRVRGGGLVVVALGKAGGREMMAGSDLDLMFVYDHPEETVDSDGRTRLPPGQYFGRAAQAMVAALTVPTRHGRLFDVDMRLRPSGGKGPVAVSLASFRRYHAQDAWTWERLALTRARVVAGPGGLRRRVARAIAVALSQGDPARIGPDTAAMRRRLAADLPPKGVWDVRLRAGGLLELEFIAQALQLRHAHVPGVLHTATRAAFAGLASAGFLEEGEAVLLIRADRVWRAVQGMLRISTGRSIPQRPGAPALGRIGQVLQRLTGFCAQSSVASVARELESIAGEVRQAFIRHVGEI